MAGRVLNLDDFIVPDQLGTSIANKYLDWETRRTDKVLAWEEVRHYVYATDTTQTSNSKLPWKNKTTIPKICQIRDNLAANYMATLFPRRKWLTWLAANDEENNPQKREAVIAYMANAIEQPYFKAEISKCVLDYIDYGNAIGMPDWVDDTQELDDKTQIGYVGPVVRRISPLDIVFNPVAADFTHTPKIIRSLVSLGEVKEMLSRLSTPDTAEEYEKLWQYLKDVRSQVHSSTGSLRVQDTYLEMDGFDSFRAYLESDYAELLTFYGDIYDRESDTFYRNHMITVVDRHKVIGKRPNPSFFGTAPIRHVGWRQRQDNLWAMGPLDNLIGMQYRLDHIENLKADLFDLTAFPPLKIKGHVEEFVWGPMEKIFVSDEGDVEIMSPDVQALNANVEIQSLQALMEEMAGAPKEALGFRSPGEKTAYEVQRLENAASRIFQSKIAQFEELFIEPLLNDMLELARRKVTTASVRVFDNELKFNSFMDLSSEDLAGNGRIRPIGARHFAEQAQMLQNINGFYSSSAGQDPAIQAHFSSVKLAQMFEDVLGIEDYEIVTPYIRLTEQADAQRMAQSQEEQIMMEAGTPSGLSEDDADESFDAALPVEEQPLNE